MKWQSTSWATAIGTGARATRSARARSRARSSSEVASVGGSNSVASVDIRGLSLTAQASRSDERYASADMNERVFPAERLEFRIVVAGKAWHVDRIAAENINLVLANEAVPQVFQANGRVRLAVGPQPRRHTTACGHSSSGRRPRPSDQRRDHVEERAVVDHPIDEDVRDDARLVDPHQA